MVAPLTQEHFTFPKEGRLESYLCQIKGMEPQVKSDTHALTLKQNQGKGFEKQDLWTKSTNASMSSTSHHIQ